MSDVPASTFTPAPMDSSKRTWLIASSCAGAAGAAALATPFVTSFAPSERAKAAGAAVEVDIASLKPGEKLTVEWRGKPVWIMRRTPEQMATLKGLDGQLADPNSERTAFPTPDYARNEARARQEHPELLVVVGICTHLGCSPVDKFQTGAQPSLPDDWKGGFFCPCHGSTFDLAGRVFKNKPAPDNLEVPPYAYLSDARLLIGEDKKQG
ncbi:MAG TPA: ubiquinol-cytochrome c reductase iron-sulfur subunit [Ottowia sp.]|jgi:ubiquinol-cytochrome c reductase iron-sulfur subunit|uniref:ubiquinol-cytochrome c reductase iron-sulfur subunit n=1 Tax=Ottowia sp. TaxID=1898956 RepID=UPI002CA62E09|nr:ubiquinol-cytochrome c reductase iron-sulfur subunit [Ottowia sp.]HMT15908.1 ubiquinol-cytochrome c reductase iron-sulfur subunit [Ottowia sp.]HMT57969.1 ubiquinol-cytochrome c reductase iron-sulfur subunit [Ottowia sp.]HMT63645.1 ubiquinol-cytochrome c reductase iron-sulfur subunit [Ottowia sp.]HMT82642.1 ubiquinol-cytochrome c reductase iron-sulfur subunit [Ottowia sp.]HNR84657.1 ubiquinol-cytochrome c reductase iron-sulfur subunit [Ottowia sp.]